MHKKQTPLRSNHSSIWTCCQSYWWIFCYPFCMAADTKNLKNDYHLTLSFKREVCNKSQTQLSLGESLTCFIYHVRIQCLQPSWMVAIAKNHKMTTMTLLFKIETCNVITKMKKSLYNCSAIQDVHLQWKSNTTKFGRQHES